LDPWGADVGESNTYPPPSGPPDPQGNPDCEWHDYDDYDCSFPDEYDDPGNDDQQAGSIPERTCIVDGFDADCNEVAANPEIYEEEQSPFGIAKMSDGTQRFVLRNLGTGEWMVPRIAPILRFVDPAKLASRRAIAETGVFDNEQNDGIPLTVGPDDNIVDFISKGYIAMRFVEAKTRFIGFAEDQIGAIRARLTMAVLWKPCVDAMKRLPGATSTMAEVLNTRGMTIVNATVLGDSSIEQKLGEQNARILRTRLKGRIEAGAWATTATEDVERIVTVYNLESWYSDLDEDVFHEGAHAVGVLGKVHLGPQLFPKHDLYHLTGGRYEELLKACKPFVSQ
jgi:hypothetical protein